MERRQAVVMIRDIYVTIYHCGCFVLHYRCYAISLRYLSLLFILRHTAGGQKWVIMMSVVQAVECYVAHFHAINYEYSNRPLPQISQYYVIYFSLITLQRIYPGIDSYSCQIQVECSSCFHSNTHTVRSPRVLRFKISFCTQRLITFQNVFDNVDNQLLCRQEILEILCPVFYW